MCRDGILCVRMNEVHITKRTPALLARQFFAIRYWTTLEIILTSNWIHVMRTVQQNYTKRRRKENILDDMIQAFPNQIKSNPIEFYRVLHPISIKIDIYHVFIFANAHALCFSRSRYQWNYKIRKLKGEKENRFWTENKKLLKEFLFYAEALTKYWNFWS